MDSLHSAIYDILGRFYMEELSFDSAMNELTVLWRIDEFSARDILMGYPIDLVLRYATIMPNVTPES